MAHISVAVGNYAFLKGEYQNANIEYLSARSSGAYGDYVSYNLGNVYSALGESEAALEEWSAAAGTKDRRLLSRVRYNEGILLFEKGRYEKAFEAFRQALKLSPDFVNAKINLEYTLQKISAKTAPASSLSAAEARLTAAEAAETSRLLEYMRRKEESVWKSSPVPPASGAKDY
jgi:tetratricopeptide (TPR) repeat protein